MAEKHLGLEGGSAYVAQVCTDGMLRVIDRLDLETRNIAVKNVPVGGREGIEDLFGFFSKARKGFRFVSRIDNQESGFDPLKFLKVVGVSEEDHAEFLINELFPSKKITNPDEKYALSAFFTFSNTLNRLVQQEAVSFYSLGVTPTPDPDMVLFTSNWQYNYNQEFIWGMIWEMEAVVRGAVLSPGFYDNSPKLLQAAHFLAATLSFRMNPS